MSPAVELRAAAAKLRAAAQPLITTRAYQDWPWDAYWAEHGAGHGVTREDEQWIGLMRPGLAEPLAALLEALANGMDELGAVEAPASGAVHPMTPLGLGAPNRVWTAALAFARVLNGTEEETAS